MDGLRWMRNGGMDEEMDEEWMGGGMDGWRMMDGRRWMGGDG